MGFLGRKLAALQMEARKAQSGTMSMKIAVKSDA
jgi:hypothetical protein